MYARVSYYISSLLWKKHKRAFVPAHHRIYIVFRPPSPPGIQVFAFLNIYLEGGFFHRLFFCRARVHNRKVVCNINPIFGRIWLYTYTFFLYTSMYNTIPTVINVCAEKEIIRKRFLRQVFSPIIYLKRIDFQFIQKCARIRAKKYGDIQVYFRHIWTVGGVHLPFVLHLNLVVNMKFHFRND